MNVYQCKFNFNKYPINVTFKSHSCFKTPHVTSLSHQLLYCHNAEKEISIKNVNNNNNLDDPIKQFQIEVISSIDKVSKEDWNACALNSTTEETNPFVKWEFLNALEQSGCAVRTKGWLAQHVLVKKQPQNEIIGCCPMYLKGHSYGEYVFDHEWAYLAQRLRIPYYPKLQICVPFSPVPGPRLLIKDTNLENRNNIIKLMAESLKNITNRMNVSSLHVTFNVKEENEILKEEGFICREGIQYHWQNNNYKNFDDFLMHLKQSKRKNIRQERKSIKKTNIEIKRLRGDDIKAHHLDTLSEFYLNTCDKKWGEAYLNRDFFYRLGSEMKDDLIIMTAFDKITGETLAMAWNLIGSDCLFGRNWGKKSHFDLKNLHFELCYYQAIETAIEYGLKRVEAGAQGDYKIQRGYMPNATYSAHYVRDLRLNDLLANAMDYETNQMRYYISYLKDTANPFK